MSEFSDNLEALKELTEPQIRALASQRDIKGWNTLTREKLVNMMARMHNLFVPVRA
jgi:hypothetical protein